MSFRGHSIKYHIPEKQKKKIQVKKYKKSSDHIAEL